MSKKPLVFFSRLFPDLEQSLRLVVFGSLPEAFAEKDQENNCVWLERTPGEKTDQKPVFLVLNTCKSLNCSVSMVLVLGVRCTSSVQRFVRDHFSDQRDFLGRYTRQYTNSTDEKYHWWNEDRDIHLPVPLEQRWKTFLPVCRLSKRLLEKMYATFHQHWSFAETHLPTMCAYWFTSTSLGDFKAPWVHGKGSPSVLHMDTTTPQCTRYPLQNKNKCISTLDKVKIRFVVPQILHR